VVICFALLSALAASIFTFYHLHRKTKRLRTETIVAEATERAKNRFYQRVNDRIHEPLHTIVSLNKQLNGSEALNFSEIEKSDMMRRLNKNSQLLNRIVNDVLDISKLESGTYKLDLSEVSVDELCQSAMKGVSDKLGRNVRLRFCPQPSDAATPLVIRTDESRLLYILSVYLSNACRHTKAGSITLAYELLPHSIRFSVTDTGRMLYSEEAAMIFSRYLTNNRDHSLGLGLYAVRLSANLLHGKAYADTSGAVSGARFYLDLPIEFDKL
jgi:K+-sensing histidine kinase KdpD